MDSLLLKSTFNKEKKEVKELGNVEDNGMIVNSIFF